MEVTPCTLTLRSEVEDIDHGETCFLNTLIETHYMDMCDPNNCDPDCDIKLFEQLVDVKAIEENFAGSSHNTKTTDSGGLFTVSTTSGRERCNFVFPNTNSTHNFLDASVCKALKKGRALPGKVVWYPFNQGYVPPSYLLSVKKDDSEWDRWTFDLNA